jgi:ferredoxin-NADP reductase
LVGPEAAALLPHTKLAITITVKEALFVKSGLPFKASVVDYSPYNPPVRPLASERDPHLPAEGSTLALSATFVSREILTPTVSRFTFRLAPSAPVKSWKRGQHVTLDFGPELDNGWEHMRDEDPQSLNDDYIRTFTVSNAPPETETLAKGTEVQITVRKHGPATNFLWRHNPRVTLEIPVVGFGGEDKFHMPMVPNHAGPEPVFVAGGVGITPLIAQAPAVLKAGAKLRALWTLRAEDLPLVIDTCERIEGLGQVLRIFVSGELDETAKKLVLKAQALGVDVSTRRIEQADVTGAGEPGNRKYFLCASPSMLKAVIAWLSGEKNVVWEDFGY